MALKKMGGDPNYLWKENLALEVQKLFRLDDHLWKGFPILPKGKPFGRLGLPVGLFI